MGTEDTRCCSQFSHQIIINICSPHSLTEASLDSDNLISFSEWKIYRGKDGSLIDFTVNWNLISRNISNISANNDWMMLIRTKRNDISPQTMAWVLVGFSIYSFNEDFLSSGTTQCHIHVSIWKVFIFNWKITFQFDLESFVVRIFCRLFSLSK